MTRYGQKSGLGPLILRGLALAVLVFLIVMGALHLIALVVPEEQVRLSDVCRAEPEACDRQRAEIDGSLGDVRLALAENRRVCLQGLQSGNLLVVDYLEFCHRQMDLLANPEDTFDAVARAKPEALRRELARTAKGQ